MSISFLIRSCFLLHVTISFHISFIHSSEQLSMYMCEINKKLTSFWNMLEAGNADFLKF